MPNRKFVLLGCFSVSLLFVAWLATSTPSYQKCEAERSHATTQQEAKNPQEISVGRFFKDTMVLAQCEGVVIDENSGLLTAIATLAIAGFTFTLKLSTDRLWEAGERQSKAMRRSIFANLVAAKAAKKSADVAEKQLLAAHRPFITIIDVELRDPDKTQDTPYIHFSLRNSGRGVGIVGQIGVTLESVEMIGDIPKPRTSFTMINYLGAIEPEETKDGNKITSALIGAQELGAIRSGEITLYFALEITCQDIFHNHGPNQKFPFIFDVTQGKFVRNGSMESKEKT